MNPNSISQHQPTHWAASAVAALRQRLPRARAWRQVSDDPSAAMFRRIRLRLILWYASVLAVVLLIVGGLLYFAMWQTVMGPINPGLANVAQVFASDWQRTCQRTNLSPCFPHDCVDQGVAYVLCYNSDVSNYLRVPGPAREAPGFLDSSLAQQALQNGSASDVVDGGNNLGSISRYALVVHDPNTHQVLGVIQLGVPIQGQLDAMQALLTLLLILLPLALVVATIGGFFLADRALAPARLAFTRQQTFIGDASHELRTPLTLLRADAEVLLRGRNRLDPDDALLLEDIVGETEHLSNIANNLLTLARLDSGAVRLESDVVDLATIATDTARRVDALAHEHGITVQMGEMTSVTVLGDAQLLNQATLALVDNALKYAGSGSEITLSTGRDDDQGTLTIHDTGPGIAAEHLPLLGQRFYRPDKARARAAGGAGLGLAVVRGILALHHGALDLESAPGEGTSAILRIPAITLIDRPDRPSESDNPDESNQSNQSDSAPAEDEAERHAPESPHR